MSESVKVLPKNINKEERKRARINKFKRNAPLYLLMLPSIIILLIFIYYPMYGVVIAFKEFKPTEGFLGSEWVGLKHFIQYFNSYKFWPTIKNTVIISGYSIIASFPLPIALALLCNQIAHKRFKKFFQVTTYLPHFISTVVMCGMLILFLSPSKGLIPQLFALIGVKLPNLMAKASSFPDIYVWSGVWQHIGWDSILYIAALSAVDPTLYEAATIDGASKLQRVLRIDIPMLLPTATIMLILRMGTVMTIGFEKVYLLQNSLNITTSEVISTYVYKMGLVSSQYSLSAAIGLFNNVLNLIILLLVNWLAKKFSDTSLI